VRLAPALAIVLASLAALIPSLPAEAETPATLTLASATDAAHWTILAVEEGADDNRPARIRLTTTRDGASLTTLKEVDFLDDTAEEWLTRNRTVLTRKSG
jgi:hypothetical protein